MSEMKLGDVPISTLNDTDNLIFAEGENIRQYGYGEVKKDILGSESLYDESLSVKEAINKNNASLSNIVSYDIVKLGAVGDGIRDNKAILKTIFSNIKDYENVYIPKGKFKIILTDSDLIDLEIGAKNMYTFLKVVGVKGIKIHGQGTLIFDTSQCTLKSSIALFQECDDITIEGVHFIGDAVFTATLQVGDEGINTDTFKHFINGINFEHCQNVKFINNTMENIMACLGVSGCRQSPAINSYSSYDTVVSHNVFKNYGQVSTFGGGTSRFIFTNNLCINSIQCGIKISTNPLITDINSIGNSYDVLIHDNIFAWEEDFEFPIVAWDTSYNFSPIGIMMECHSRNVSIKNNIIDIGRILQQITNPVQTSACISILRGNENINFQNNMIDISGNTLTSYSTNNNAINIAPFVEDLYIHNNVIKGDLLIGTGNPITKTYRFLGIENNIFYNDLKYVCIGLENIQYETINIKSNTVKTTIYDSNTTYKCLIELNIIVATTLNISNNNLGVGDIVSYSNNLLAINQININSNTLQSVILYTTSAIEVINLTNNVYKATKTIQRLTVGNSSAIVNVCGNSGKSGGILNIDQGKLRLDGNSINPSVSIPYTLGSAILYSGMYIGSGAPTANAISGCMYVDMLISGTAYMKTTMSGTSGWLKLATVTT